MLARGKMSRCVKKYRDPLNALKIFTRNPGGDEPASCFVHLWKGEILLDMAIFGGVFCS